MITVIYKKGDATKPENYRPICGRGQLYKLFSAMTYSRLHGELDLYQCPDQQGSGKIQTADHLMTYRLTSQKRREWRTDMWVAAIDSKKVIDSIQHNAIWRSLSFGL